MSSDGLIQSLENAAERSKEDMRDAIHAITPCDNNCKSHPAVMHLNSTMVTGIGTVLDGQVTIAKYLTNGGGKRVSDAKRLKVGPVELDGYRVADVLRIIVVIVVLWIGWQTYMARMAAPTDTARIIRQTGTMIDMLSRIAPREVTP
jgi:hypothetical protein